ncbi:hypothetical protein CP8484711_1529, partial [Chlamydia psittaci 84-8471/1]
SGKIFILLPIKLRYFCKDTYVC